MPPPGSLLRRALEEVHHAPPDLWPGFVPADIPTLIFDGAQTWLNAMTPDEAGWEETPHGWRWQERHPVLVANTALALPGGRPAAGILLNAVPNLNAVRLAALVIHEAFHVWQAQHPSSAWEANELDALSFPADDAPILHARAEETACLRAALACGSDWQTAARAALAWRHFRYGLLQPRHRLYERRLETLEGLAHFVETRFLDAAPDLCPLGSVGMTVREWPYRSGAALAGLLCRGADGWQAEIMEGRPLDEVLAGRIGQPKSRPPASPSLRDAATQAAQAHAHALERLRQNFDARPGPRLRLRGTGIRVTGFDPLNVHVLPGEQVLHTRYLRVEVPDGALEVLGGQALAAGEDLLRPVGLTVADVPETTVTCGRWNSHSPHLRTDLPAANLQVTPDGWELWLD